jgi:hypothetical protein
MSNEFTVKLDSWEMLAIETALLYYHRKKGLHQESLDKLLAKLSGWDFPEYIGEEK